ncbi:RAB7A-interacting MON1-CCZ1 complex subunit 1 isoform X1 [Eublepharis macularius]|uniref:RAB7A-interacting MON1-CCZ1 complex subunit 1 isoform X1 n=1 Tax=Eublepharis macularius TaxID=481883 RepID=A0AA97JQ01_EUBMA|nr:RAB7A-interacting MON1-CCZ1 complex subunit 1 isoform X1 [Eublepharis macularius]
MAGVGLAGPLQQRLPGLEERLCRLCHLRNDEDSADAFLMQASATLETLKQLSEDGGENSTFSNLVQLYAQAVLDITYFEENQLIDEDFLEVSSLQKVEELIHVLSEPEALIKESGENEPLSVLGVELLECLYWRRGALLYMFCHTVKGRKEWLMEKMETFKKFLSEGVNYLVKMLGFRCSVDLNEEFVSQDADTARLLHEGIFSDTHLLAMMYSGEMCYWGLNYFGKGKPPLQSTDSGSNSEQHCSARTEIVDFRDMGEKMLKKYIDVCEGPLREHEWNTRNAKLILDYFRQLST